MIRTVLLADMPSQPWKNGGGLTRDLLAWPMSSAWQLRISVAEIERSGPFSPYPGVARCFAVVQGAGVVLHFADGPHRLSPGSPPLLFDGAVAPGCDLVEGPTLDLNLLAVQAFGRAGMAVAAPGVGWASPAPLRAVFTARPAELTIEGRLAATLPAMSLAYTTTATSATWQLGPDGAMPQAWWMDYDPHSA